MNLTCPRCSTLLADDIVAVTDGLNGIIAATPTPAPIERRHCICGQFTWTRTSTRSTTHQPHLTLIEGAA